MNLSPMNPPEGSDPSLSSSNAMMAVGMRIKPEKENVQVVGIKQELEDKVPNIIIANDDIFPPNIFPQVQMAQNMAPGIIREFCLNLATRTQVMPINGVATIDHWTPPPRLYVRFNPATRQIYITKKDPMGQITPEENMLIFTGGTNFYHQPWTSPVGTPALINIQIDNLLYSMAFPRNLDRILALEYIHGCVV